VAPARFITWSTSTLSRIAIGVVVAAFCGCGYNPALTAVHATEWVPATTNGLRTVNTLVVIDPFWHKNNNSSLEVMAAVSGRWERDFGIRFAVVEVIRDRVTGFNSIYKLLHLRERYPAAAGRDLVILFTGSTGLLTLEVTQVLGNHVVIGPNQLEATTPIVHHGLGHIFGAPHSLLPGNFMTAWALPVVTTQVARLGGFDGSAREAIALNKWRSFGVESELLRSSVSADASTSPSMAGSEHPHSGKD